MYSFRRSTYYYCRIIILNCRKNTVSWIISFSNFKILNLLTFCKTFKMNICIYKAFNLVKIVTSCFDIGFEFYSFSQLFITIYSYSQNKFLFKVVVDLFYNLYKLLKAVWPNARSRSRVVRPRTVTPMFMSIFVVCF